MKEKTLIIPDVHTDWETVESIVKYHPDATRIISLGDWFDDWNDTPEQNFETALYLKEKFKDPRWTFLWGNHDISYAFPGKYTICAGFSLDKLRAIHSLMTQRDWDQFKFHCWINDYLCTHAGLDNTFVSEGTDIRKMLSNEEDDAQLAMRGQRPHWFYEAGKGRFRNATRKAGGLVWCDVDCEFTPVPNCKQIFGHTFQSSRRPVVMDRPKIKSENYCIDTALRHYICIEENELTIESSFKS